MIITKKMIEDIANEIWTELEKRGENTDVCIYYNNKRIHDKGSKIVIVENDINPLDYFDYAATKHVLSMSFEGPLYEDINYGDGAPWLSKILDKYGLYYELGNAWNLSVYPDEYDDYKNIAFTDYSEDSKTEKPISLSISTCDNIPELQNIMIAWWRLSKMTGDIGSCVIGAGYNFAYKDQKYFMPAQSPYQGSISWETHKDIVKEMLANIGAENITYDNGIMD